MAIYNPTYQTDPYAGLSEEERKRRQEEEARAAAMADEAVASGGGYRQAPTLSQVVGQAYDKRMGNLEDRLNTAQGYFTDPLAAIQKRLGVGETETEATPVKQTITIDPQTGEQKIKIEGSARDLSAANPLTPTIVGPVAPEQQAQQDQQFAQQMAQYRAPQPQPRTMAQPSMPVVQPTAVGQAPQVPQPQPRPVAPPPVPAELPAQGAIPATAATQPVEIPGLPKVGPAVQLAGPITAVSPQQLAAQPAPAAAPAPAPAPEAPWIRAANEAGTDFNRLLDVAAKHPESRDFINEKLTKAFANKTKEDEANKLYKDAAAGDLKAQNKIFQMIKPETGKPKEEVTTGDYVRAYMYKRLGLDALAQDVQNKIIGKDTKFGQVTIGGSNWQVETGPDGNIIRAKDDEGNFATESTLNKLRAAGTKFGQQATQYTGGIHTVPNAEGTGVDLVMPTQNQIDPTKSGFTYLSGPKQGQMYTGTATPQPQSIGTSYSKALDKAFIDFSTSPTIAGATRALELAYATDPGDGSVINQARARINSQRPDIFNQVKNYSPSGNVSERLPADAAEVDRVNRDLAAVDRSIASTNKNTALDPARKAQSLAVLNDERNKLVQRQQQLGGPVAAGGTTPAPAAGGMSLTQRQAQQKAEVEVGAKRSESFNKHIDENVTPDAMNGADIASTRKQQFAIFDRPGVDAGKIFGIANGAGSTPGDQRWTMFRDILLGKVSAPEDQIRQRAAALGLNREEQSAVAEYAIANADINAKTLKGTAGPGSVSEAEQKLNQARNIDPTQVPMLGGYNAMAQSQFNGDLAKYRGDWAVNSRASNTAQLESEWRREKAKLSEMYINMARQRIEYMSGFGNTPAAIKEGYRRFPVPQYDPNANNGQGGWIKTKPITNFDR